MNDFMVDNLHALPYIYASDLLFSDMYEHAYVCRALCLSYRKKPLNAILSVLFQGGE